MYERLTALRHALVEAPAAGVAERFTEFVTRRYALADAELFLVDYRLAALVPLRGGAPHTHPGTPTWRCFDHQEVVTDGQSTLLPVTVRGERLGVVRLTGLGDDRERHAELAQAVLALAHELAAAWSRTDRYVAAARTRRLTLAAEMQWELLPGRACAGAGFDLAGQLEPAYGVRGDTFDWAHDEARVYLAVINGMGEGVAAAMLTALCTHALRNARRAGLPLADAAALADQAVYGQYQGAQHVEALLLELDLVTGRLTVVDAGSPRLFLLRDGDLISPRLEPQFPFGMFEDSLYRPETLTLRPGDRLVVLSDGVVHAARQAARYGDGALDRFLRRAGALAPLEAVRSLLGDLRAFLGGDLADDAVAVCLDWSGPAPGPADAPA
ncbi:MAG TPA: PP2C family protein-serine/threonine phosphatase [Pilimelia sp.]|nr:PP2C family protein-serine/threonine phosphatase [Pilimelia sp.]